MTDKLPAVSRYRTSIPKEHQATVDTRMRWLWMQRLGTIQSIWSRTDDYEDKLACTVILQAVMGADLQSIQTLFTRLEGGAQEDEFVAAQPLRV